METRIKLTALHQAHQMAGVAFWEPYLYSRDISFLSLPS